MKKEKTKENKNDNDALWSMCAINRMFRAIWTQTVYSQNKHASLGKAILKCSEEPNIAKQTKNLFI